MWQRLWLEYYFYIYRSLGKVSSIYFRDVEINRSKRTHYWRSSSVVLYLTQTVRSNPVDFLLLVFQLEQSLLLLNFLTTRVSCALLPIILNPKCKVWVLLWQPYWSQQYMLSNLLVSRYLPIIQDWRTVVKRLWLLMWYIRHFLLLYLRGE